MKTKIILFLILSLGFGFAAHLFTGVIDPNIRTKLAIDSVNGNTDAYRAYTLSAVYAGGASAIASCVFFIAIFFRNIFPRAAKKAADSK